MKSTILIAGVCDTPRRVDRRWRRREYYDADNASRSMGSDDRSKPQLCSPSSRLWSIAICTSTSTSPPRRIVWIPFQAAI